MATGIDLDDVLRRHRRELHVHCYRAFKLDVLDVRDGAIAQITTFGYATFLGLGLPEVIPDE